MGRGLSDMNAVYQSLWSNNGRKCKDVLFLGLSPIQIEIYCLNIVQGDYAKSTCIRVICSLEIVLCLLHRAQLGNCGLSIVALVLGVT